MASFSGTELDGEHAELFATAKRFANDVLRPAGKEWDEREETPWPIIEEAARIGIYTYEHYRRCLADPTGQLNVAVNEEMAWGDAGLSMAVNGSKLAVSAILSSGTAEQADEWIPQCYGTPDAPSVAAFCVTEADAGSDVARITTRAIFDEASDTWTIDGSKMWITNGGIADVHVVVASVDPDLGARGQASFVVPPGTPGLIQTRKLSKMGIRASHTAALALEGVRVPGRCLLGGREKLEERLRRARAGERTATQDALSTFEASRPLAGAQATGIARAAYEYALDWAINRKSFNKTLIEHQAIGFTLAEMATKIDAARLLCQRAAFMAAKGEPFLRAEGSMAKLYAGEVAVWSTERAIQILGGYGYSKDHPVERWYRDAKIYTIFEGTAEIQKIVITRALSGVRVR